MATLYCSKCGDGFEPDTDHVWFEAEVKRMGDRNDREDFALCMDCWLNLGWEQPA